MKLTKKLEAEVMKAYNAYWDSYLKGDMKTMASFLDDDIKVIGSTETEVFYNKKAVLKFYKVTAGQVAGTAQFRNRDIKIELIDGLVLITEKLDFYVLIDGKWTFYAKGRLSSLLSKKEDGWKFIQQHGSMPDTRAEEGEQFSVEKISKENLELRQAVKRRTVELESKNRELEIETALEKVRAVAMGMKKADDMLNICKTISQQLQSLGVNEIRNVQTAIFYESRGTYMNYEYYAKHNKTFITEVDYKNHKIQLAFAKKMLKGPNGEMLEHLKGKKLQDWYSYQKSTNQFADNYLLKAHSVNYYWYSLGPVALGISTYYPLTKDETVLFKRFLKVFELAYRRYLDIEKATAQTKEALIEAALERIRARALAMHKSAEFFDVARVMREQMGNLGQPELETSAVHLYEEDADTIYSWRAFRLSSKLKGNINFGFFKIPKTSSAVAREFVQKFKSKATDYTIEVSGAKQTEWYKILFKLAPEVADAMKKSGTTKEKRYYHFSKFTGGALLMVSSKEPSNDAIELQKRSAQVFDLAYRRFKDLQKAEAQAREAKIELALERVRARAMAMQNSNELAELVSTLFKELTQLDFSLTSCIIWMHAHSNDTLWIASAEMNQPAQPFRVQPFYPAFFTSIIQAWKTKDPHWTFALTGSEKKNFEKAFFKELPELPDAFIKALKVPKQVVFSASFNNFGALEIVETAALTEEKFDILHRFGKVFDSSYTRFNDLQKAEAQAREAQIELGLERVRARAMAMQNSNELAELVDTVFKELTKLHFLLDRCIIMINDPITNGSTWWLANPEPAAVPVGLFVKYHQHKPNLDYLTAWKSRTIRWEYVLEGKNKKDWDAFLFTETDLILLPDFVKTGMQSFDKIYLNVSFNNFGNLTVSTSEPLQADHFDILLRFAKVFDSTYTRFNDLQKAEEQAREAQIELALERVRARTMAMQHSEELSETVAVMFEQFKALGEEPERMAIEIVNEKENVFEIWATQHGGSRLNFLLKASLDEPHVMQKMYKAWKLKTRSITIDLKGKELEEYFNYLKKEGLPVQRKLFGARRIQNVATFSKGILTIITPEPRPQETIHLLERFAAVFDGTYTRFLDLQKAEAQAREAQIELALERVRARTMAMQHSEELRDTSLILFDQLKELGEPAEQCTIGIIKESDGVVEISATLHGNKMQQTFRHKLDEPFVMAKMFKSWKDQQKTLVLEIKEEELQKYNQYRNELVGKETFPVKLLPGDRWIIHIAYFSKGMLALSTNEPRPAVSLQLLERFAIVFEQTYTRFLDLQKAEAQSREAQIELGLERVRARAMAMQNSDELAAAAQLLYHEFGNLGINTFSCGYMFIDEAIQTQTAWVVLPDGSLLPNFISFPLTGDHVLNSRYKDWKEKKPLHIFEIQGEANKEHHRFLSNYVPPFVVEDIFSKMPDRVIFNCANFSDGYLLILATEKFTPEDQQTIIRFGKVFEQTYTRFLDLQKAEAQAREAQIELGLERVRARAMAMQNSDQLKELIGTVFTELTKLDLALTRCIIWVFEPATNAARWWMANSEESSNPMSFYLKYHEHPAYLTFVQEWKNKNVKFVYDLNGADKVAWDDILFNETELKQLPDVVKNGMKAPERVLLSASFNNFGGINVASLEPLSDEHFDILLRFAKVFDLTYTRFNDLQKAEAQAREAQIELGLERVRAKAMAMQKSDELSELVDTVFKELTKLDFALTWCIINIIDESSLSNTIWAANPDINKAPESYHMLFEDYPYHHAILKDWKERKTKSVYALEGDEKRIYDDYLFSETEFKKTPEIAKAASRAMEKYVCSFSFCNFGGLQTVGDVPLSAANLDILSRFGKVFDLTYTRFNDLKQAEAQAREAQIEVSLERVRARTMAMQHSYELQDAAILLFQQIKSLGVETGSCGFNIWDKNEKTATVWMSSAEGGLQAPFKLPHTESAIYKQVYTAMKNGEDFLVKEVSGKPLEIHFDYLLTQPGIGDVIKRLRETGYTFPKAIVYNFVFFNNGYLSFHLHEHHPETEDVFKRFAKVFEQTYTRFLDLQKAEAQAREAHIEAALERVRSKSMAMHHSDDLITVINVVKEQLIQLGFHFHAANFVTDYSENGYTMWLASPGESYPFKIYVPQTEVKLFKPVNDAVEKGLDLATYTLTFEEKNIYFRHFFENTLAKNTTENVKQVVYEGKGMAASVILLNKVRLNLMNLDLVPYTNEENTILKRFGYVFEQSYTRFLDLQKAEAQAREAQIEVSLERVRARTMAMHNSDDVSIATATMFTELEKLGIENIRGGITIISRDQQQEVWSITKLDDGKIIRSIGIFDMRLHPFWQEIFKGWNNKEQFQHYWLGGKDKEDYINILNTTPNYLSQPIEEIPDLHIQSYFFGEGAVWANSLIPHSEEDKKIMKRFASVFSLTFRRYRDLQKAEAQARESQIQLALERVRARTMAMQQSNELPEAANNLFLQVQTLGIPAWSAGYCIWDEDKLGITLWMSSEGVMQPSAHAPCTEDPSFIHMREAYERGDAFHVEEIGGEALVTHYQYMRTLPVVGEILDSIIEAGHPLPVFQIFHCVYFSQGFLLFITYEPVPEAHDIFKRFGKVFDQTYTRFLDLQKAEAQAREAQIEAALERIRSSSLAMHKSEELKEVASMVFRQLKELNIEMSTVSILLLSAHNADLNIWIGMESENDYSTKSIYIPQNDHPDLAYYFAAIKSRTSIFTKTYNYKEKNKIWNYLFEHSDFKMIPDERKGFILDAEAYTFSIALLKNTGMQFARFSNTPFSQTEYEILIRFCKVFEQAYTRFLDLQKAEAQAREAQIEACLERVRSKTVAMHNSKDVGETVASLFDEYSKLGIETFRCGIGTIHQERKMEVWTAKRNADGMVNFFTGYMDMTIHPLLQGAYSAWKNKEESYEYELKGDDLKEYFSRSNNNPHYPLKYDISSLPSRLIFCTFYFPEGFLFTFTLEKISTESTKIFKRFSFVFGQTYRRFLDLQKAEAQAREAQIQLALERVRARTMAMQHSDELKEAAALLFQQAKALGVPAYSCGYNIWEKNDKTFTSWMSTQDGSIINGVPDIPLTEDANFIRYVESKQNGEPFFVLELRGERMQEHYAYLKTIPAFKDYFDYAISVGFDLPQTQIHHLANFSQGNLLFITLEPCPEFHDVFKRFAAVFEQTYTRFLDLQKAESQAREAQIEAALERVRASAMAMHHSTELTHVLSVLFEQFDVLGICPVYSQMSLLDLDTNTFVYRCTGKLGKRVMAQQTVAIDSLDIWKETVEKWKNSEPKSINELYFPNEVIPGLFELFKEIRSSTPAEALPTVEDFPEGLYVTEGNCQFGYMGFAHSRKATVEEKDIVLKFATEFGRLYQRFLDLQKAEAQAREAKIEAALEKARSRSMGMQSSDELPEVANVLFLEVQALGIPAWSCGYNILAEDKTSAKCCMSSEGTLQTPFKLRLFGEASFDEMGDFLRSEKTMLVQELGDKALEEHYAYMKSFPDLKPTFDQIDELGLSLPTYQINHLCQFTQGFLLFITYEKVPEAHDIFKRFTKVFEQTYTRFLDLQKAEAQVLRAEQDLIAIKEARKKAEEALTELQETQKQLIQSEKMASLGELTAGIAHEIQNPLNFVNNFSEVNKELLVEMKDEINKGNLDDANAIANDVIANSEKINHHGKRAGDIVKGMLQHSRSSSGVKELTDINTLADEYLRLAYHGLRANDKNFNATMNTDFDETIGNINIIPQDIGRVILNLITNAFYAAPLPPEGGFKDPDYVHSPTVWVSTKKEGNKVLISVRDNGPGISNKILDKIFQPFFTTKPTGQGTGLGLSLSYDIVKAHGGELTVETKEGEGSEFIINIPFNK